MSSCHLHNAFQVGGIGRYVTWQGRSSSGCSVEKNEIVILEWLLQLKTCHGGSSRLVGGDFCDKLKE